MLAFSQSKRFLFVYRIQHPVFGLGSGPKAAAAQMTARESWETFGKRYLDRRVTKAVQKLGFEHPTAVQSAVIPKAVEGQDVLAKE